MSDRNYAASQLGGSNAAMSRIESNIEDVKRATARVRGLEGRIMRHARSLGYFDPTTPPGGLAQVSPVITTLADALRELDQAIEEASGALNVFD